MSTTRGRRNRVLSVFVASSIVALLFLGWISFKFATKPERLRLVCTGFNTVDLGDFYLPGIFVEKTPDDTEQMKSPLLLIGYLEKPRLAMSSEMTTKAVWIHVEGTDTPVVGSKLQSKEYRIWTGPNGDEDIGDITTSRIVILPEPLIIEVLQIDASGCRLRILGGANDLHPIQGVNSFEYYQK